MMDTNKIIGELEESLKEIESAREQVVKVTTSSEKTIDGITNLIKEVQKLTSSFEEETNKAIKAFEGNADSFKKRLVEIAETNEKSLKDNLNIFKSITKELVESSIKLQKESLNVVSQLKEYCGKVQELIDEITGIDLPRKITEFEKKIEKIDTNISLTTKSNRIHFYITWILSVALFLMLYFK